MPEEAELEYLNNAKKLAMYGIELHQAKVSEVSSVKLPCNLYLNIVFISSCTSENNLIGTDCVSLPSPRRLAPVLPSPSALPLLFLLFLLPLPLFLLYIFLIAMLVLSLLSFSSSLLFLLPVLFLFSSLLCSSLFSCSFSLLLLLFLLLLVLLFDDNQSRCWNRSSKIVKIQSIKRSSMSLCNCF